MVLAAGYGKRMRPLTDHRPKPLVEFRGRALIDHVFDRLIDAGVQRIVVNGHYFGDQIQRHIEQRTPPPEFHFSDESEALLDTGGGIAHALPVLGEKPFLTLNSDTVWHEADNVKNINRLTTAWNDASMDCLMLLADRAHMLGYDGAGDFVITSNNGQLRRRQTEDGKAQVFAGVSIVHPRLFQNKPEDKAFSMNVLWDHALAEKRVYGVTLDGTWMHIGTPDALLAAENWMSKHTPARA